MRGYVGVTDNDWFEFLAQQRGIDEVNFWQPGGNRIFNAISAKELFLFKLRRPNHKYIAGGGLFAHSTIYPISLAWEAFGLQNGAPSYLEMRRMIERNRHQPPSFEDYHIGCIILTQPFFFSRNQWIPIPPDFNLNIVQGKTYDLSRGYGRLLLQQVQERLASMGEPVIQKNIMGDSANRYGEPLFILPRLGQGSFRVIVTDAYQRRCAITGEKTLPALEAAHVKPFSESGPHAVNNGLLLRSDIHRLFDSGYVTITTRHHFEVSNRIREEFDNGEAYRALHGQKIWVPPAPGFQPDPDYLAWHNDNVFRT
jgi:putative restriction endonuclease